MRIWWILRISLLWTSQHDFLDIWQKQGCRTLPTSCDKGSTTTTTTKSLLDSGLKVKLMNQDIFVLPNFAVVAFLFSRVFFCIDFLKHYSAKLHCFNNFLEEQTDKQTQNLKTFSVKTCRYSTISPPAPEISVTIRSPFLFSHAALADASSGGRFHLQFNIIT